MKTFYGKVIPVFAVVVIFAAIGCARERGSVRETIKCMFSRCVSEPPERSGLETVPFYPTNSAAFASSSAQRVGAEKDVTAPEMTDAEKEKLIVARAKAASTKDGVSLATESWKNPDNIAENKLPEAVRKLPKDKFGYVDWSASQVDGFVDPRWSISDFGKDPEEFDLDIVFEINDQMMANVLFEHRKHVSWLTCTNCHPSIFIPQKGANTFNMYDVWDGKYCGKCHGTVAFQPKGFDNCQRCHSVKKKTAAAGR
ncbi:MAG: hypothetical protein OEV59_09340 [Deltaproteobacteria bacterium]|nr:hypothetical protein [Deltaproteobacteria bacterium]